MALVSKWLCALFFRRLAACHQLGKWVVALVAIRRILGNFRILGIHLRSCGPLARVNRPTRGLLGVDMSTVSVMLPLTNVRRLLVLRSRVTASSKDGAQTTLGRSICARSLRRQLRAAYREHRNRMGHERHVKS